MYRHLIPLLLITAAWLPSLTAAEAFPAQPGVLSTRFVYDHADFPECHASSIESTDAGLIATWFGGTEEKNPDVCIYVARFANDNKDGKWTAPALVADGVQDDGKRYPCWNPVLYNSGKDNLLLFYKVGPSPREWWGMLKVSRDQGQTWSAAKRLPDNMLGPIRAKPVRLTNGRLLCPSSNESNGWRVFMESCDENGENWDIVGPLNTKEEFSAIQPTVLRYSDSRLQILNRTRQGVISECWSEDDGRTWAKMQATSLPNPNSGIDAVTLKDGRQLLIYNHTTRGVKFPSGRQMINLAISKDGRQWQAAATLDRQRGEHSYPAMIQTPDGLVHILYTYHRKTLKHVVVDPSKLQLRPIKDGQWPG